jgi:hypothetical protein
LDHDPAGLSAYIRKAFAAFFKQIKAAGAAHVGVTYNGHGARADGSLFEGSIHSADAQMLLTQVTGIEPHTVVALRAHDNASLSAVSTTASKLALPEVTPPEDTARLNMGRLAMLNFGTNCAEGRWDMLAALYPFAEWILASDLNVGGGEPARSAPQDVKMKLLDRKKELEDSTVLMQTTATKMPMRSVVQKLVLSRRKIWEEVWRESIKILQLAQTIAAYEAANVPPFQTSLIAAYRELRPSQRLAFESHVEAATCDVLEASRFLDQPTSSAASFLSGSSKHLSTVSRHQHGSSLEDKFLAMRPFFERTEWAPVNGLGFNFVGWHAPPCDIKSALGDVTPPSGGWKSERYALLLRSNASRL